MLGTVPMEDVIECMAGEIEVGTIMIFVGVAADDGVTPGVSLRDIGELHGRGPVRLRSKLETNMLDVALYIL